MDENDEIFNRDAIMDLHQLRSKVRKRLDEFEEAARLKRLAEEKKKAEK